MSRIWEESAHPGRIGSPIHKRLVKQPSPETVASGVTFLRTATSVTVTDENPQPGSGFYQFEAVLEP